MNRTSSDLGMACAECGRNDFQLALKLFCGDGGAGGDDGVGKLQNLSSYRYSSYYRPPNCFSMALRGATYGGSIGAAWGVASGLSSTAGAGLPTSYAVRFIGRTAVQHAIGFGGWSACYQGSRCLLFRARGTHDLIGAVMAGGFTGGVMTLAYTRGSIAAARPMMAANAAGSAFIAGVFSLLGGM